MIRHYTREAGVRNLEREIGTICRKQARRIAEGKTEKLVVTPEVIAGIPGRHQDPHRRRSRRAHEARRRGGGPGVDAGGRRRAVHRSERDAGQRGFTMTGQLGPVMQESVQAALTWVRSNATQLGIHGELLHDHDIHIHVPAGAIPKDGPSAGVTMATALVSMLTDRPVRPNLAMTGEITLSGKVLPVGGIKEKVLAAKRAACAT